MVQIIQSKLIGPWFTIKERESHLILISSSSRKIRSSLERRSAIVRSFRREKDQDRDPQATSSSSSGSRRSPRSTSWPEV